MATKLEQAKQELEAMANNQGTQNNTASATPTSSANPTVPKKPVWHPRWVAVKNSDGSFAKFGKLTLTAPRDLVKMDGELKPVSVDVVAGTTTIATVDVPSDSSVWSIRSASREIKSSLSYMVRDIRMESVKDGSADILTAVFNDGLVLRIYIGGINNTVIPSAIVNRYGLVVFRAEQVLDTWAVDTMLTTNFEEALDWLKAKCPMTVETPEESGNMPF